MKITRDHLHTFIRSSICDNIHGTTLTPESIASTQISQLSTLLVLWFLLTCAGVKHLSLPLRKQHQEGELPTGWTYLRSRPNPVALDDAHHLDQGRLHGARRHSLSEFLYKGSIQLLNNKSCIYYFVKLQ